MRKIVTLFLLPFLFLPVLSAAQPNTVSLVFTHVTVIDVAAKDVKSALIPDQTVIVTGNRIAALGKTGRVNVPAGARVIDATGKYLIPGLWDMHTHLFAEEKKDSLPLFFLHLNVANGVTGVRDMGSIEETMDEDGQWRKAAALGAVVSPRIFMAGAMIDDPRNKMPHRIIHASNAQEGRAAVDEIKKHGMDFVKVYAYLSREAYFGIADEAKKQGLPFAGHVPLSVSAVEASDAGQKSFEHLWGILLSCSKDEAELTRKVNEENTRADKPISQRRGYTLYIQQLLDTYDEGKAAALFSLFVKNGTYQVPTFVTQHMRAYLGEIQKAGDPHAKYIAKSILREWDAPDGVSAEELAARRKIFDADLKLVGAMQRAGVTMMAGTDTPSEYVVPGYSLHDELGWFVKAGLTPLEALRTATLNPARYLGLIDSLGTVKQGKLADLVLLEADPLEDIGNTRRISAVLADGRYLPKEALQKMLAEAEAAAK